MNQRHNIEILAPGASLAEMAAVVAAVEQFQRDTAPAATAAKQTDRPSPWRRAGLEDGVSRQPDLTEFWA